ncbi:MAG: drug/metabolite transporter (DMT)-like permease [Gammaproteobacteria bacterium]|jgi:drug/metabolite transporter (DMT)-like permease
MKKAGLSIIIALICFSIASPVVKLLGQSGGMLGDAISFCNLLFIGNFCAGIVVLISFGARGIIKELRSFNLKQHSLLSLGVIIAGLYPALIYTALESTSVTNVVMLSRFEGILYAFLAWWIFKTALSRNEIIGLSVIGVGVLTIVFLKEMYMFRNGDYIILIAAVVEAFGIVVSKKILTFCSLRTFLFARNFFSSIGFFIIAIYLFGFHHFQDAFQTELWGLIAIYALVVIVLGQYMWYKGVKSASSETLSSLTMLSPFLTLLFAYILLYETPDFYEWCAIGLILTGMVITRIKSTRKKEVISQIDKSFSGG